jgi:large subunit ribosomal protein L25
MAKKRGPEAKPKRLRVDGYVPAVVYGAHTAATSLMVATREMEDLLASKGAARGLISLEIEGDAEAKTVVIKEVQKDPVRGSVLHVDFHHISLKEKMKTQVPIVLTGEEEADEKGGIVQHQLRVIEVECLPTAIPDSLTGDISDLEIGQQLRVGDLPIPPEVEVLTDPDEVVVSLLAPRRLEEEEEEEAEEEVEEAPATETEGEEASAEKQ